MPENSPKSFFQRLKLTLLGKPIASKHAHNERLGPVIGLPVFASDALSSTAYATEAILMILILASVAALQFQLGISLAVVILIVIVVLSYSQTIKAYPKGGGSYIVASDNLGEKPGLVAGAALMIDYTLTVAVSISAGAAAIVSAQPQLHSYLVPISLFFIGLVTLANLRGMKESGALFAIPTYGFVFFMGVMLVMGITKSLSMPPTQQDIDAANLIGKDMEHPLMFIVLRAFAAGCTALTGIEAVSDGVQAFRDPAPRNAIITLGAMGIILSVLFLGMGYISAHLPQISLHRATDPNFRTLASQIATFSFGQGSFLFYIFQFFTAAILVLAANTAYADFPRLCSFIARDGYLPRYMARLGDRLVFHNGIIFLAIASGILVVIYNGALEQLLPLYAVGVFTAFCLSQSSMVVYWRRVRTKGWKTSFALNLTGLTACGIVLIIILVTKFTEGAWLVCILMPLIYTAFVFTKKYYKNSSAKLAIKPNQLAITVKSDHIVVLLVPRVHKGLLNALTYARQLNGKVEALHVTLNEKAIPELQRNWSQFAGEIPLTILPSPFRSLTDPIVDYVDDLRKDDNDVTITVIVTEAVSGKWYQRFMSENVAQQLKNQLGERKGVIVSNVRYFLEP